MNLRLLCYLLVTGLPLICTAGCSVFSGDGGGELTVRSMVEPGTSLKSEFKTGMYRYDNSGNVTIILFDGPPENPSQAVTIRMFWQPRAGRTPISAAATNATVHHMVFTGDNNTHVGIYSGAGFVYPNNKPGDDTLAGGVWDVTLMLVDRSEGFTDLLGQSNMKGRFTARRDDIGTEEMLRRLNINVSQYLGYPRLVDNSPTPPVLAHHQ